MQVLIADGASRVRSALRLYVENCRTDVTIHEAASLSEIQGVLARTSVDVALVDWQLPDLGGAEALRLLRDAHDTTRVIVLSGRPEARQEASLARADAFVSKGDPPEKLHTALDRVAGCRAP